MTLERLGYFPTPTKQSVTLPRNPVVEFVVVARELIKHATNPGSRKIISANPIRMAVHPRGGPPIDENWLNRTASSLYIELERDGNMNDAPLIVHAIDAAVGGRGEPIETPRLDKVIASARHSSEDLGEIESMINFGVKPDAEFLGQLTSYCIDHFELIPDAQRLINPERSPADGEVFFG